jgi:hypothetical protein
MTRCEQCGAEVDTDEEFCAACGQIFGDEVKCHNHPGSEADSACVICRRPCCGECGGFQGRVFLCEEHASVDAFEQGVAVLSTTDLRVGQAAFEALRDRGYHPFFIPRAIVPVTNIGRLTPNQSVGPHLVIVPFGEYEQAMGVLAELEIT